MILRDILVSLIRTVVPVLTGLALAQLAKLGIDVDGALLNVLFDTLVTGAWYALVRWAETRWPLVGVLLGWKAQPTYTPPRS